MAIHEDIDHTGIPGVGGAGDITTDAAWAAKGDLIVGTANDTAAVLTVGTNDHVLTAASGEATGLKWAAAAGAVTGSEAALASDVTLTNADQYYDGPSLSLNGTYLIIAHGNFRVGSAQDIAMKLWNGTTVSASGSVTPNANTYTGTITIAGYVVTSGAETWKISAASNGTSAKIKAATSTNGSGNNATKIVAIKIA